MLNSNNFTLVTGIKCSILSPDVAYPGYFLWGSSFSPSRCLDSTSNYAAM